MTSLTEPARRYPKGTRVTCTVTKLLSYGAAVTLEDGSPGIVRNRELQWGAEPASPAGVVARRQRMNVLVIGYDDKRVPPRLELSLRQAERDPWLELEARLPVGAEVATVVDRLHPGGAFVTIKEGVSGYLPIEEICDPPPQRVEDKLWTGDSILAVVTRLDHAERRVTISIRQCLARQKEQAAAAPLPSQAHGDYRLVEALRARDREALARYLGTYHLDRAAEQPEATRHGPILARLPRILIAEDDAGFRTSLARLLRYFGHQVDEVESADEAVARAADHHYDLVIMDLGFDAGSLDGVEATCRLLQHDRSLAIVIISGIDWLADHSSGFSVARACGAKCALLKPVGLHTLQDVLLRVAAGEDAWSLAQLPDEGQIADLAQQDKRRSQLPPSQMDLSALISQRLSALLAATGANAALLFRREPATADVTVAAHKGTPLDANPPATYVLDKSPVSDVILQQSPLHEPDCRRHPLRYRNMNLLPFSSCIGVPVSIDGATDHALFLFHPDPEHFSLLDVDQAVAGAHLLETEILRQHVNHIVRQAQALIFMGQIGSTLVHELNNLLGSVLLDADQLRQAYGRIASDPSIALDPQWRDELGRTIEHLGEKGKDTHNIGWHYLGLLGQGKSMPVNVNDIVQRCTGILEPVARRMRIRLATSLAADLPSTLLVPARLQQAFLNLMLNAVQQTNLAKGSGNLFITTTFEDSERPLKIRFSDSGPGIHFLHRQAMFKLGFTTRDDGAGIGLYVSRDLVESLGGRLSIERSHMLVGTTFLVELPVVLHSTQEVS